MKFLSVLVLLFSLSAHAGDPNLNSYKVAGECSNLSPNEKCVYCPLKKKFIALPVNSKDQTPKDENYEFVEPGKSKEGVQ
jgi:hypothetical protein